MKSDFLTVAHRAGFLVMCLSLLLMIGFAVHWLSLEYGDPFNDRAFDRRTWLAYAGSDPPENQRGPMAEDLMRRHLPKGMPRGDVLRLLGKPDRTEKPAELSRSSPEQKLGEVFVYWLGMWTYHRWDHDNLLIGFDRSGRLASVWMEHN